MRKSLVICFLVVLSSSSTFPRQSVFVRSKYVYEKPISLNMDTKYFDSFNASPEKVKTARIMVSVLQDMNITNNYIIAGILAVVSKESDFTLKPESSYRNTSASRIRQIFGSRVSSLTDAEIDSLKKDDPKFFNTVYGGKWGRDNLGNINPNDGYNYRGRGFNQLTGRANYEKYAKQIDVPIDKNPNLLADIRVACEVLASYFIRNISAMNNVQKKTYGFSDINTFTSAGDAAKAAYNANAGIGKTPVQCAADTTGGYVRTLARVDQFYTFIESLV